MKKNKMMVFKKNSIVTMALISILVVAGYLNYADKQAIKEDAAEVSTVENEQPEIKEEEPEHYGEAKFVSADKNSGDSEKLKAEKERSRAIEIYRGISEGDIATEEQKKDAALKAEKAADAMISEANIESVLAGKGFKNPCVTVGEQNVYVSVIADELDAAELAMIRETVIEETGVSSDKIRVSVNN